MWKKSSYCWHGSSCVEWKVSSHSANGNCVETAGTGTLVLVRDSKDPRGPVLKFTPGEWRAFLRDLGRQPSGRSSG